MKFQTKKAALFMVTFSLLTLSACCSHDWNDATCTEPKICAKCGETQGEALGHNWLDATCTKPALCSICAETVGEALGHDWKDATCTEASACRTCNTTNGEALGHKIESWHITQDSSCTETGSEEGVCVTCSQTVSQTIPLEEHTSSDWVITVEPTESSKGTREKTCKTCGKVLETEQFSLSAEELAQKVQKLLPDAITQYDASLAAEDFARYQHQIPGMFLWLGVGEAAALHNGKFVVPEEVLPIGVDAWARLANHKW